MRRFLGSALPALLLVAALGACGDEDGGTASDDTTPTASDSATPPDSPAPTDSPAPSDSPSEDTTGDEVDFELVQMLTETAAGGSVSETGVPLGDDAAVQAFSAQFEEQTLPTRVKDAVAATTVPDGMLLYGAVVAIGCDSPTGVSVTRAEDGSGLVITADKVPSPMQECFAPMTTVALVLVPAAAVS